MDSGWRKKLVYLSLAPKNGSVLDCACGTGALAIAFSQAMGPKAQITGVDFCEEMLKKARNDRGRIKYQKADINNLPFKENSFDVCAIAYGLRNTENIHKTLLEMSRVTKPGGVLMILETGRPFWLFRPFFYIYFRYVVPRIGGFITGQRKAYEYLQTSSRHFPSGQEMLNLLQKTRRLKKLSFRSLFFGASFIYRAEVL